MTTSLLAQLNLTASALASIQGEPRRRVLTFLLRWEAFGEVLACLDLLAVDALRGLRDLQAQALAGAGRAAEAVALSKAQEGGHTPLALATLARYQLQAGEKAAAVECVRQLTRQHPNEAAFWGLLGDIHLACDDLAAAEGDYLRQQRLAANNRQPLLGLMEIHKRRNSLVTAQAYAVRAYTSEEDRSDFTIPQLRQLRSFFAAMGDENHRADVTALLLHRFDRELAEARKIGADKETGRQGDGISRRVVAGEPSNPKAKASRQVVDREPSNPKSKIKNQKSYITDLATIPVSAAERSRLEAGLRKLFGYDTLLSAQLQIMACALRGEHVLAVLPTGAGKSLCYQLPAFLDAGLTLVISPLIALMKDQVDNLPPSLRSQAIAINSSMADRELDQALKEMAAGRYKLVYVAPERLRQWPFVELLRRIGLTRLVIDEAHCVSVWGHDFRPDYLYIAQAHRDLGSPPILALTATAPPLVREDIQRQLIGECRVGSVEYGVASLPHSPLPTPHSPLPTSMRIIATDSFRANLTLHVLRLDEDEQRLGYVVALCKKFKGCGIVYARTRQRCEELAALLNAQGVQAEHYHAGIADRVGVQDRFIGGQTRIIVATIAFGMGVDKPDIRFVIHYGLPNSLEGYYQEIGRAGRDGKPANCVLLYTASDRAVLNRLATENQLSVEFLRKVYQGVAGTRHGSAELAERPPLATRHSFTLLSLDALAKQLQRDGTIVRVAVSMLEEAGLLRRYYDAPRTLTLRMLAAGNDPLFTQAMRAAGVKMNQPAEFNYLELAAVTQIPPDQLEKRLSAWQAAGWLYLRTSGREPLLYLSPTSQDASQRVHSRLDQYATIQRQRVAEMIDYVLAKRCRHGYLANYLGGAPRTQCGICDGCGATLPIKIADSFLSEAEQRRIVLLALSENGWGRRNLVRLLRGDPEVGERGQAASVFGKLHFRSENGLIQLIADMLEEGLLEEKPLSHGGVALAVATQGKKQTR